jgi:glycosyltransferase involved in cell wall biosynthesis
MAALLSILIPNYNRADSLIRALDSIYHSIERASASASVSVVVIDDFSTEPISEAIAPYRLRPNFRFQMQAQKCGNAELAFLSALEYVDTEYTWLVGNDDRLLAEGVGRVLDILQTDAPGFVLLNPGITKTSTNQTSVPLRAEPDTVRYEKAEDLFLDFGFVTSTTTFSCLVFKTEPVRTFHRAHRLPLHARVYSHTFTLYGALRLQPAVYVSHPLVNFTLNEVADEQSKLLRQAPGGVLFYHHTVGLARLLRECTRAVGIPVARLGSAMEDEVNKDNMSVIPTTLSHFLLIYFLEQLCQEQENVRAARRDFGHLSRARITEIGAVVEQLGDEALARLFGESLGIFNSRALSAASKIERLRDRQQRIRRLDQERFGAAPDASPDVPRKILSSRCAVPLRGTGKAGNRRSL